jgi:hypothetical protein
MMLVTEGKVIAILDNGFAIRGKGASGMRVRTQIPGHELNLKIGDHVKVFGGYGDEGQGTFLSSGVFRKCRDGSTVRLRVNWVDGPDEVVEEAKRPWWRFWRQLRRAANLS